MVACLSAYPRRSDLDENAPFGLAAELELLREAHMFVGNMGSHTSRMMYMKMVSCLCPGSNANLTYT